MFSKINWIAVLIFFVMLLILRKPKMNPILIMVISGAAGVVFYL